MSNFTDRLKQSLDSRLPHFSTSIPYIIATVLIMLVPLTVTLSQQTTRPRSGAQMIPEKQYTINVTVIDNKTVAKIADARVTSLQDRAAVCYTDNTGICSLPTSKSGIHKVRAYKGDVYGESEVEIPSDASSASVTVALDLPQPKNTKASPSPSKKYFYPVIITVTNSEDGTAIADANVSIDYQPDQHCPTNTNGRCSVHVTKHEPGQVHKVYAYKQDEFDLGEKEFTINPAADGTNVSIALAPVSEKQSSPTPAPTVAGSARLEFSVDEVGGFPIKGASVALDRGSGGICTTNVNGICHLPMHRPSGTYFIKASKPGYKPSVEQKYQGNGKSSQIVNLKLEKQGTGDPTPPKDDGSQPPSDDTRDPNTGGPNDTDTPDDGSNPPSPDDLKCLGSCETPTPTPPYCITPAPTGEEPEDTGTPQPSNQSIFDMVRQRINEAFSRFGDFFNTTPTK